MVNLFGNGFIGSYYSKHYDTVVNSRNDLIPRFKDVLYTISTVTNSSIEANPYIDIETNLITLMRVLENWRGRYRGGVFNFVSSWFVYGNTELPAREDSVCNPVGIYSITKHAAERLLDAYCTQFDLRYRIIRLANVVGAGDHKAGQSKNVFNYLIKEAKYNRPVHLFFNGEMTRDYIHIHDACEAIHRIVSTGDVNATYNVGNGISTSMNEVLRLARSFGSSSSITLIDEPPPYHFYIKDMVLDNTKLLGLGYRPSYTVDMMVKDVYNAS